ncbi:neutral ceramidase [Jatrophihabitans sp. GAS493]|uniref:neutral/alkaline non-lysosomal ceramidase N-terminal domain-containing protein n=1 Tax=Jatrophihabitans sp. GAS493 TaxID=1907575 RepID=UPI000BBF7A8C|nr:neutral/alkaline non-lysosomal ceramidase N-terminal domain-containing protein [Jatrophihabitans sp. GAS493]SOD74322.1 neutral ceramidase [Jatrophihabitans sp. GAS493]
MPNVGFRVGSGRADITGEPADCGMLGYGKRTQRSAGIHLRLNARAFIFARSAAGGDGVERVLLVVAELPLIFDSVHRAVLARLAAEGGGGYDATNTLITATHTHCGPGGYSHHRMYNSTTHGFRPATFDAIVGGIVTAVRRAERDLTENPADAILRLTQAELFGASVNRSRSSFERNPAADRAPFPHAVDPLSTLLRIERGGELTAAVHFFATHGTSMTNKNNLISSDNKGFAAYSCERSVPPERGSGASAGPVFAFAQTNSGDMSPNLALRPGHGPTDDEFANASLIGARQAASALALAQVPATPMPVHLDAVMSYVRFADLPVAPRFTGDGEVHRTGQVCAGSSALAGAGADGRGFAGFREGRGRIGDWTNRLRYRLQPDLAGRQAPKCVAVSGATLNRRVPFVADAAPMQLLRIGDLYLLGVPAEVTIVAGLQLRRTVAGVLGADLDHVLVCGYSNGYLHYVTTPAEYDEQRYEGGSTLFGRWQLPAMCQVAHELAEAMVQRRVPTGPGLLPQPPAAPRPPRVSYRQPLDRLDAGRRFGDLIAGPRPRYRPGDRVVVSFHSGNLNNGVGRVERFLEVQRREPGAEPGWERVADDGDPQTMLRWQRSRSRPGDRYRLGRPHRLGNALRPGRRDREQGSIISITWQIPVGTTGGEYRIIHHGTARTGSHGSYDFSGQTPPFEVR